MSSKTFRNGSSIILAAAFTAAVVTAGTMVFDSYYTPEETTAQVIEESTGENMAAGEDQLPKLTDTQYRLLEILYEKMYENDLEGAAIHLNENEHQFSELYYNCLKEQDYLFDGEELRKELDGKGIVLKRSSTVFYGYFENGCPEGVATALKAIVLDTPRYDYSIGTWKNGLLNGPAKIGYDCYGGTEEDEKPKIVKEGTFLDDLMDGDIIYRTVNSGGTANTWEMSVKQGVTIITSQWTYNEENNDYRLASKNDINHVYILKADETRAVRWMNMVKWPQ